MAAQTAPRFYVFHGPDEFSRAETLADFKRRLGPPDMVDLNTTRLRGRGLSLAELEHACGAVPFMAEKRLVIVEGLLSRLNAQKQKDRLEALVAYVKRLPETTRLVFVEEKALRASHPLLKLAQEDELGYAKRFEAPQARSLPRWIEKQARRYDGGIEPRAAAHLATLVGGDLRLLDQEIRKLVAYADDRPITREDVETLVPYAQEAVIFDMVDALGQRDGQTAAQTLHRLLDEGEHPLGLMGMIVRQFRLLIQVKELKATGADAAAISKRLGLHPFPTRKLYGQATHFTADQLETVYRHLLETDVAIKTGQVEPVVALDLLIAGLAPA